MVSGGGGRHELFPSMAVLGCAPGDPSGALVGPSWAHVGPCGAPVAPLRARIGPLWALVRHHEHLWRCGQCARRSHLGLPSLRRASVRCLSVARSLCGKPSSCESWDSVGMVPSSEAPKGAWGPAVGRPFSNMTVIRPRTIASAGGRVRSKEALGPPSPPSPEAKPRRSDI